MSKKLAKKGFKRVFSDSIEEYVEVVLEGLWDQFVIEPHLYCRIMELDRLCRRIHDVEFLVWAKATKKAGVFHLHTPLVPTSVANDQNCFVGYYPEEPVGCFHRHPAGCREFSGFDEQVTLYLYTVVAILLEKGEFRQIKAHDREVSARKGQRDRFGPCYHPGFRLDRGLLEAVAKDRVKGFYEIRGTNVHVMTLKLGRNGKPKVVEMPWITECIEMLLADGCFAVVMMDRHTVFGEVPLVWESFVALWEGVKEYLGRKFELDQEYTLGSTKILSLYPKRPPGFLAKYQYLGKF